MCGRSIISAERSKEMTRMRRIKTKMDQPVGDWRKLPWNGRKEGRKKRSRERWRDIKIEVWSKINREREREKSRSE